MLDVTCDHLLQSVSSGYQVAAHLLIDVTCNEACSACSGLATSSANPTGASGASPAASDAAAAPMEEDNSAQLLGLPEVDPGNQPKKRRLSAPKVKKSREEIFQDEVDKIRAKYEELLANMRDPTAQMPTPAATAKVQRILSAKLVESKEQWGCFETTTALEELEKAVLLFKEALKMTSAYLPHNSHPKKAHGDGFVAAMEKLSQNVLKRFPEPVLTHYRHLTYLKDRSMSGLASHPLQCVVV